MTASLARSPRIRRCLVLVVMLVAWSAALCVPAVAQIVVPRNTPSPSTSRGAATRSPSTNAGERSRYEQVYYGDEAYMAAYRRVIKSYNRSLSEEQLESIVRSVLYYSWRFNVDPRFVVAVVACESAFRPHAVSSAGAGGLGQLMPGTARELKVDPFVPYQNIQGTVRYLKLNLDRFRHLKRHEQMRLCLASYNAGYGAVQTYGGVPPYSETINYVNVVMSEFRRLSGER